MMRNIKFIRKFRKVNRGVNFVFLFSWFMFLGRVLVKKFLKYIFNIYIVLIILECILISSLNRWLKYGILFIKVLLWLCFF